MTADVPGLAGKRVLVAEDNALIRAAVCEMLEAQGAQAVAAEDGEQAVLAFAACPFDVVLMDVCMEGMDGYAAAQAIRYMDGRVLIFAHTDAGTQYGAGEAQENGMDGCVRKMSLGELARVLRP